MREPGKRGGLFIVLNASFASEKKKVMTFAGTYYRGGNKFER